MLFISDPIPIPERKAGSRKSLDQKEALLYAPMCNMGNVIYDRDAVYIDLPSAVFTPKEQLVEEVDPKSAKAQQGGVVSDDDADHSGGNAPGKEDVDDDAPKPEGVAMVHELQSLNAGIDRKMASGGLQLFSNRRKVYKSVRDPIKRTGESPQVSSEVDSGRAATKTRTKAARQRTSLLLGGGVSSSDDEEGSSDNESESGSDGEENGDTSRDARSDASGSDDDDGESDSDSEESGDGVESSARWKQALTAKAAEAFAERKRTRVNLMELVYGRSGRGDEGADSDSGNSDSDDGSSSDGDNFFKVRYDVHAVLLFCMGNG